MAEQPGFESAPSGQGGSGKARVSTGLKPKIDIDTSGLRTAARDVEAFDKSFEKLFRRLDEWTDKRAPILERKLGAITSHMSGGSSVAGANSAAVSQQAAAAKESAEKSLSQVSAQRPATFSTSHPGYSGNPPPGGRAGGQGSSSGANGGDGISFGKGAAFIGATTALSSARYFGSQQGLSSQTDLVSSHWALTRPGTSINAASQAMFSQLGRGLDRGDVASAAGTLSAYGQFGSQQSRAMFGAANTFAGITPGMGVSGGADLATSMMNPETMLRARRFGITLAPGGNLRNPTDTFAQVNQMIWGGDPTSAQAGSIRPGSRGYTSAMTVLGDPGLVDAYSQFSRQSAAYRESGGRGQFDPQNQRHRERIGLGETDSLYEATRARDMQVGASDEGALRNTRGSQISGIAAEADVRSAIRDIGSNIPVVATGLSALAPLVGTIGTLSSSIIQLTLAMQIMGGNPMGAAGAVGTRAMNMVGGRGTLLRGAAMSTGGALAGSVAERVSGGNPWASALAAAGAGAGIGAITGAGVFSLPGAAVGGVVGLGTHLLGNLLGGDPVGADGGGTRPMASAYSGGIPPNLSGNGVDGLDPEFKRRLAQMYAERPTLGVTIGKRSVAVQERIFRERMRKGVPSAIDRKGTMWNGERWYRHSGAPVAAPGRSKHQVGLALDIAYASGPQGNADRAWVAANHRRFGLHLPMPSVEPWHLELPGSVTPSGTETDTGAPSEGFGGMSGGTEAASSGMAHATTYGRAGANEADILRSLIGAGPSAPSGGGGGGSSSAGSAGSEMTAGAYSGGTSARDIYNLARSVGFDHRHAELMTAVSFYESSWNPRAHNPNASTGDNSYGLWQINMINTLGPARRKQYGITTNEELFDPVQNAKAAWAIAGGNNEANIRRHWSAYDKAVNNLDTIRAQINQQGDPVDSGPAGYSGGQVAGGHVTSHSHVHHWSVRVEHASAEEAANLARMVQAHIEEAEERARIGAS